MAKKQKTISPLYVHDKPKSTISEKFRGYVPILCFQMQIKKLIVY